MFRGAWHVGFARGALWRCMGRGFGLAYICRAGSGLTTCLLPAFFSFPFIWQFFLACCILSFLSFQSLSRNRAIPWGVAEDHRRRVSFLGKMGASLCTFAGPRCRLDDLLHLHRSLSSSLQDGSAVGPRRPSWSRAHFGLRVPPLRKLDRAKRHC